ncbi:hypothetical protein HC024_07225 [Methylococcaceae bacterium WWC4]|nr:hypothetical protein [Methylococcaceae bacterium WWC4]
MNVAVIEKDYEPGAIASTAFAILHPYSGINNRFIYYFLRSPMFINRVEKVMKGVAYPAINDGDFFQSIFPLPPVNEQHRIVVKIEQLMARCDELEKLRAEREQRRISVHAAAINRLTSPTASFPRRRESLTAENHASRTCALEDMRGNDDGVDSSNEAWQFITQHFAELYAVKPNVAELRKAILQLAVMGKLVPQNPNDPSARQTLNEIQTQKLRLVERKLLKIGQTTEDSKFINSDISIPDAWVWAKGAEIFFITKLAGFEYTKHFNLTDNGDIPVIRAQNVRPFSIETDNLKFIDRKTSELLERCALTKPALLVTFIGAGIGDVALFDRPERWHLAPNVAKMEPFTDCENKINLRFINYFLISTVGRREIFKHLKSTAQPSISMGTIRDIDYPLPPLPEQHRIVAKIDSLMALCDTLEQQIDAATSKQTALLDAVMAQGIRELPCV